MTVTGAHDFRGLTVARAAAHPVLYVLDRGAGKFLLATVISQSYKTLLYYKTKCSGFVCVFRCCVPILVYHLFIYDTSLQCSFFYFLPKNAEISFCEPFEECMCSSMCFLCVSIIEWFNEGLSAKEGT